MKNLLLALALLIISTSIFSQGLEFEDFALQENMPEWINYNKLKTPDSLLIDRKLNPFYLESDFNGDNSIDVAIFVLNKTNNKRGILIIHGDSYETYLIGAGTNFVKVGDDLSFVNVWKVYRKPSADETMVYKNNIVKKKTTMLFNHAISICKEETPPNLIYWDGTNYNWLHTGD